MRLVTGMMRRARGVIAVVGSRLRRDDSGMTTAEYAVGTIAACAFAAVLYKVVTGDSVLKALSKIVTSALDVKL